MLAIKASSPGPQCCILGKYGHAKLVTIRGIVTCNIALEMVAISCAIFEKRTLRFSYFHKPTFSILIEIHIQKQSLFANFSGFHLLVQPLR